MGILYPKGYDYMIGIIIDVNIFWWLMIFNYHTIYIMKRKKKRNDDVFQLSYYLYIGKGKRNDDDRYCLDDCYCFN